MSLSATAAGLMHSNRTRAKGANDSDLLLENWFESELETELR